jgi:hypothetical protein
VFLYNLNVFVPCWAMASLLLGPVFLGRRLEVWLGSGWPLAAYSPTLVGKATCVVVALALAAIWAVKGLSPAHPQAARRYRIGHLVTAITSAIAAIIVGRPFVLDFLDGGGRSSHADWDLLIAGVLAAPPWLAGLLLIWTSYGAVRGRPAARANPD